jgi:hypothetical protein
MSVQEEIERELANGRKPTEVIDDGYSRSTVYKVNRRLQRGEERHFRQPLRVTEFSWNKDRHQPGDTAILNFSIRNTLDYDFYYSHFGVQPTWKEEQGAWVAQEEEDDPLLRAGEEKSMEVSFNIPEGLPLGDYDAHLAFEGAFIRKDANRIDTEVELKFPITLPIEVKEELKNVTVFFSHSVQNQSLYSNMIHELDNQGFRVILGEEERQPGENLEEKFADLIDESDIFLGLITKEAIESEWVQFEVDYAYQEDKPMLLMVEEGVQGLDVGFEYIEFSKDEDAAELNSKLFQGLQDFVQRTKNRASETGIPSEVYYAAGGVAVGYLVAKILSE